MVRLEKFLYTIMRKNKHLLYRVIIQKRTKRKAFAVAEGFVEDSSAEKKTVRADLIGGRRLK